MWENKEPCPITARCEMGQLRKDDYGMSCRGMYLGSRGRRITSTRASLGYTENVSPEKKGRGVPGEYPCGPAIPLLLWVFSWNQAEIPNSAHIS